MPKKLISILLLVCLLPCLLLAETKANLKGKIIILDPGHGGSDSGATTAKLIEKNLNLEVALRLEKLLTGAKAAVYLTRRDDRDVSLVERVRFFHKYQADAVISLHHNAKPYDPAADEVAVYRPSFPTPEAKRLANLISSELVKATGNPRGALGPANYYILENSRDLPIVIAEPYYLTHEKHIKLLQDSATLDLEAEAYFNALILFFDPTER